MRSVPDLKQGHVAARHPLSYYIDRVTPFATAIVQLDVDSGTRHEITGRKSGDYFADLRCSPDGKSLVYLKYDTTADLVIVRDLASGKELILGRITKAMSTQWPASAAWSEDSRTVLVAASGGSEIMAYPVDGGAAYRVYAAASAIGHLAVQTRGVLAFEAEASRTNLARATARPPGNPISSMQPTAFPSRPALRPTALWRFCQIAPAPTRSGP